jgi:DNA-binding MarR family transcriptional regulator
VTRPATQEPIFALLTEIGIIAHLTATRFDRASPGGLNASQFGVLNHFARTGKAFETPAKLARAFQVTKGNMTNTVQRLEALGFVSVEPDPTDGRGKRVRPTSAGMAAHAAAVEALRPQFETLIAGLDRAGIEAALPAVRALRLALDEAPDR